MDYYYILQRIPIFDISDKFVGLQNPQPPHRHHHRQGFVWDLNIQLSNSAISNDYKILFTL